MLRVLVCAVAIAAGYLMVRLIANEEPLFERPNPTREQARQRRRERRNIVFNNILNGTVDCNICLDKCNRNQKVYFCRECLTSFHISCLNKWIDANPASRPTCPDCREQLNTPIFYTCMCGRKEPVRGKSSCMPFSCGRECCKNCGDDCHPGKCI